MFKRLLCCLLLSMNLSALDNDESDNILLTTTIIIISSIGGAAVAAGGIIAAPLVLPAGTIVIIQTTAVATVPYGIAAGTYVVSNLSVPFCISLGISGACVVRLYIIQTNEEQLTQFNKAERAELHEVKTKLSRCFTQHKADSQRDSSGCPTVCEDIAFTYAILAGQNEFDRVIKSLQ